MKNIYLLNGPNLNLLGTREPEKYGSLSYEDLIKSLKIYLSNKGLTLKAYQSNQEGELIDLLHTAYKDEECIGVVINPGGYTHTSVSLRDAILAIDKNVVEVHITNPSEREDFRQKNLISDIVSSSIVGEGTEGYFKALDFLLSYEK